MLSSLLRTLINIVFGLAETIVGVRIILRLFGANSQSPFVAWIYEASEPLLAPFARMFPSPTIEGGFVVEFSALFALIMYALANFLIIEIINYIDFHREELVNKK